MNSEVTALLNDQITHEFYSAYLYLAFANYYYDQNLDGFGHWFSIQAKEEVEHGLKFLKYLQDNNEKATLKTIEAPDANFNGPREPLVASLKHEQFVTGLIHAIYKKAREVDDFRCCQFLEWFIAEQGEEEKNASDLVAKYDLLGGQPQDLYLLNSELKTRPDTTTSQGPAE